MGRIILNCPSTGRRLDTGIRLPRKVFESYLPKNAKSFCPYCHRTHVWSKQLMELDDEDDDSRETAADG